MKKNNIITMLPTLLTFFPFKDILKVTLWVNKFI